MNNYLTNIVARTLNIAPSVRPRLRGRFDPLPAASREPVDPALEHRTVARDSNQQVETGKTNAPRENTARIREGDSAAPRHPREGLTANALNDSREPARVTDSPAEQAQPRRTTVHDETTLAASTTIHFDAPQLEQGNLPSTQNDARVVATTTQPASSTAPLFDNPPASAERQAVRADSWTIPAFQPASRRHDEDDAAREHPYLAAGTEADLPTFRVEEPLPNLFLRDPEPRQKPRNDAAPENSFDGDGSTEQSVIIPTRISPRVEIGPERFLLHRPPTPQPQPTIHVTIGRVEVRAVRTGPQARSTSKENPSQPVMKLDEYLRGRGQGNGR